MSTQSPWLFETPVTYSGRTDDQEFEFENEWEWEVGPSIDIASAVAYNRKYRVQFGWQPYIDRIVSLLGFKLYTPIEEDFAQAVAAWQQKRGLNPDGKIGPTTWKKMQSELGLGTLPKQPSKPVSGTGNCIEQRTCRACERRIHAVHLDRLVPIPAKLLYGAQTIQLDPQALKAYQQLYQAARSNGIPDPYLKILSGYRSYSRQANLWKKRLLDKFRTLNCSEASLSCIGHAIDRTNRKLETQPLPHSQNLWLDTFLKELKQGGCHLSCDPRTAVKALRVGTAPPGRSPHHTGRAIDIFVGRAPGSRSSTSTASTAVAWQRKQPSFQWLVCNAARFGFYPYNREPWHWEYSPPN